jgi:plastocyanin
VARAVRRSFALLAVLAVLALAVPALADEQIQAIPVDKYTTSDVTIDQGEPLTFKNSDFDAHSVTARKDGSVNGALFDTGLIGMGEDKFVEGSQYLTTGDYAFFCTTHDFMTGTLHVTSAGTPVPRPGSAGDKTPADLAVSIYKRKLGTVVKKKKLLVKVTLNEAAQVDLVAKLGTRTVAKATDVDLEQGTEKVNLKLTRSGKKKLKARVEDERKAKLVVTANATDKANNDSSDSGRRTLKP